MKARAKMKAPKANTSKYKRSKCSFILRLINVAENVCLYVQKQTVLVVLFC